MPAKFDRCVKHLRDQGYTLDKSFAICQVSVNKAKSKNKKPDKEESAKHESRKSDKMEDMMEGEKD